MFEILKGGKIRSVNEDNFLSSAIVKENPKMGI